jgi:hypothetical protein
MDLGFHLQLTINVNKHPWNLNIRSNASKKNVKTLQTNIQDQHNIIDE